MPIGRKLTAARRSELVEQLRRKDVGMLRRLFVFGSSLAFATGVAAVLAPGTNHDNTQLLAVSFIGLSLGAVMLAGAALPRWLQRQFAFTGAVLLISLTCVVSRPMGAVPFYFIWPALTCGYFGTRLDVRITLAAMAISFAIALSLAHGVVGPVVYYLTAMPIFASVLIGFFRFSERTDQLVEELARAATTDSLTGLLNRRAFSQALIREVVRSERAELPLSLIVFDLDHFKRVNDSYGHPVGDDALRAFAAILGQGRTATDLVARLGGEEFAMLLFNADGADAERRVERVARALGDWSRERGLKLTTSAGVASFSRGLDTPEALVKAADRALYAAKEAGRNRVLVSGATTPSLLLAAA
jgi:diguanylate cyclase (GGDEF)-like protein